MSNVIPTSAFTCHNCNKTQIGTDYAFYNGDKVCYACCVTLDRAEMLRQGNSKNLPLYLISDKEGKLLVKNWPGTLSFHVSRSRIGKHNIANSRVDVWFWGPDDHEWWGVHYGDYGQWTEIVHCKRTKRRKYNGVE